MGVFKNIEIERSDRGPLIQASNVVWDILSQIDRPEGVDFLKQFLAEADEPLQFDLFEQNLDAHE